MSKSKEKEYINYLEKKGYMVFDNIKELKKIVLETSSIDELAGILANKIAEESDCGCS
jgi:hypothetical protein